MCDKCSKNETITGALGISDEWESKNSDDILEVMKKSNLISDVIIAHIQRVKMEEFALDGITERDITLYEKKLIWSGMEIARMIYMSKERNNPAIGFIKMLQEIAKDQRPKKEDRVS